MYLGEETESKYSSVQSEEFGDRERQKTLLQKRKRQHMYSQSIDLVVRAPEDTRDLKIPGREILGRGIMAEETLGRVHRRKAPKLNLRNARTRSRTDQCRIIVYNFLTT